MQNKLLLIGPLPKVGQSKTYGGATVLFKTLHDFLSSEGIPFQLIITNKYTGRIGKLLNLIIPYLKVMWFAPSNDIIFCNLSSNGAKYLAPFCYCVSKLFGKKFVFRVFGGWIVDLLNGQGISSAILRYIVKSADIMIMESQYLIKQCQSFRKEIYWLPNSRKPDKSVTDFTANFTKRFVFISQVKESKGIDLIITAGASLIKQGYTLDIYGPIADEKYNNIHSSGQYKGALTERDVLQTLKNYDVLILPTYYEGEGYPGIIIEAYAAGKPVISTDWKAIPEIVEDKITGILIVPKSYESFEAAVLAFNVENYPIYSKNAHFKFNEFDSDKIHNNLIQHIISN